MTIEQVESLRDEYLGIKKQLEELKKELKDKSDSETKKKADDLNEKAQAKEKQLKEAIQQVKESKSSTEQQKQKAAEIENALKTPTQEIGQLYNSIIESLWSSSVWTSSTSSASTDSSSGENFFKKTWNWIKEQWGDIWKKEEWDKNPWTNILRTLWFAATWVWGLALGYKWIKSLFWLWSDEEEDGSETRADQLEEKGKNPWEPEEEPSFWNSWLWKTLKWLWFWSAAWGGIYFLGKQLKWWGNKDNKTDGKTSDGQGNKPQESKEKLPEDTALVSVEKYISDIKIDMRYATKNNFTWEIVYDSTEAKLRYGTIKKLSDAQEALKKQWYSLKIWDAYRPQSAQEKFKKIVKDPNLVAQWRSDHTRWCAVDVTLVKSDGSEIPMPSEFDDFNHKDKCKSDFSAVSWEEKKNWQILQKAMSDAGFWTIWGEWWHFYDKDKNKYDFI